MTTLREMDGTTLYIWEVFPTGNRTRDLGVRHLIAIRPFQIVLSRASEAGSPTNRSGSDKTRGQGSFGPQVDQTYRGASNLRSCNLSIFRAAFLKAALIIQISANVFMYGTEDVIGGLTQGPCPSWGL